MFDTFIQVFVMEEQTPLPPPDDSTSRFRELVDAYNCVKCQYAEKRATIQEETERKKRYFTNLSWVALICMLRWPFY
jgi:hypothetical protein